VFNDTSDMAIPVTSILELKTTLNETSNIYTVGYIYIYII